MNCKKIRDLLLTDYLDAQADLKLKTQVQIHLQVCEACRRFEQEVRLSISGPFKKFAAPKPPQLIWLNIKEKIIERQARKVSLLDLIRERLKVFYLPIPAFSFVAAAVIFLVMLTVFAKYRTDKNHVRDYFAQQIDFYYALDSTEENGNQDQGTGFLAEEYFF